MPEKTKDERWYSASDLKRTFGKSHQYWGILMKKGKIKAKHTAAGFITTHTWLLESGYVDKIEIKLNMKVKDIKKWRGSKGTV